MSGHRLCRKLVLADADAFAVGHQRRSDHGCLAGEGCGKIPQILADAVQRGYDGFATLEPHLLGGGPTGGVTGPDLFPKAVAAYQRVLEQVGAQYQ